MKGPKSTFVLRQSHIEILKVLVANLNRKFTQIKLAKLIGKGKSYKNVRESIKALVQNKIIVTEEVGASILCTLNVNEQKTLDYITFIENSNKYELYKKNPKLKEISERLIEQIKLHTPFFTMLVFGSYAKGTHHERSDIDIIIITDRKHINTVNKEVSNLQAIYTEKISVMPMTRKDYEQMLMSKEEVNVGKESLKNHVIMYGSELYYQIVADVYGAR